MVIPGGGEGLPTCPDQFSGITVAGVGEVELGMRNRLGTRWGHLAWQGRNFNVNEVFAWLQGLSGGEPRANTEANPPGKKPTRGKLSLTGQHVQI